MHTINVETVVPKAFCIDSGADGLAVLVNGDDLCKAGLSPLELRYVGEATQLSQ